MWRREPATASKSVDLSLVREGEAEEGATMLIDAGTGSGASCGDETGPRGVHGQVPQGSARRVGSLWDHALQAQKRGEAAYLRKRAEREQQVPAQS